MITLRSASLISIIPSSVSAQAISAGLLRQNRQFALAHLFASRAAAMARPADILFVEDAAYRWRALDELAIAAFYAEHHDEGRRAIERLLNECLAPLEEGERLQRNAAFYGITSP